MSVVEELVLEGPTSAPRVRRGEPLVYVLSGILVLIVLCALFAPLLAPLMTMAPVPAKTNPKVPKNSATSFFVFCFVIRLYSHGRI